MTRIENLHRRRKRLGLSLLRYYHAFMFGYSDKGTESKCPYKQEQLITAYWEGRRTEHDYSKIASDLMPKKGLTPER
ncbi:hypothetical protein CL634_08775 [bacterium]|nr:hypothetical protein [bacterium]|tara:strand:+ start:574 stop:804 length:231 start_codon:yes stop_codon:yes gene_type:complete